MDEATARQSEARFTCVWRDHVVQVIDGPYLLRNEPDDDLMRDERGDPIWYVIVQASRVPLVGRAIEVFLSECSSLLRVVEDDDG